MCIPTPPLTEIVLTVIYFSSNVDTSDLKGETPWQVLVAMTASPVDRYDGDGRDATHNAEHHSLRRTLSDELRDLGLPHTLKAVGRLDYMTSGLMLLVRPGIV